MSEYEIAELTATVLSNFLTAITVFLSVVSAYVICAYAAGDNLTKIQLAIINLSFSISVGILGFLVIALYRRFYTLAQSVKLAKDTIVAVDLSWPLFVLLMIIVIGCFVFMWSERTGDDD